MPESQAAAPAQDAAAGHPAHLGDKGIKFEIRTGAQRWTCTLQDRGTYERKKALRANSTDSVHSNASTASARST